MLTLPNSESHFISAWLLRWRDEIKLLPGISVPDPTTPWDLYIISIDYCVEWHESADFRLELLFAELRYYGTLRQFWKQDRHFSKPMRAEGRIENVKDCHEMSQWPTCLPQPVSYAVPRARTQRTNTQARE